MVQAQEKEQSFFPVNMCFSCAYASMLVLYKFPTTEHATQNNNTQLASMFGVMERFIGEIRTNTNHNHRQ